MRIVTWNMGCGSRLGGYRKTHDEAWDYLIEELRPDVAFVQEAVVTKIEEAGRNHSVTMCNLGPGTEAGTAVLVRGFEASPATSIQVSTHSYMATVKVKADANWLSCVAVHVGTGDQHHTDLARLADLLGPLSSEPMLVGGDFNAARRFDEVYGGKKYQKFFDAMAAVGFEDAHWAKHGREIQSFWGRRAKEKYQDDHFFIAKPWAPRVASCNVVDNDTVRRLSDHGPVMLELDVTQQ